MLKLTFARYLLSRLKEEYALCYRKHAFPGGERVHRKAIVLKDSWCDLSVGDHSWVEAGTVIYARNDVPNAVEDNSHIRIGPRCFIGHYCNLRTGGGHIEIGEDVILGQFVSLIASGHGIAAGERIHYQAVPADRRNVRIEDDVWIGAGAIVLPGVTIHAGAVIGAGAVVTKDVPAHVVMAGNPARELHPRS